MVAVRVGDPVIVTAHWSSFRGMRGRVTQTSPHLMILIERDTYPIRVGVREVTVDEPSTVNLTGAE